MNSTKKDLADLKELLGVSNMEYQMVADRIAQTILKCGITYFSETTDDDAPDKAMALLKYALSITGGHVARGRCQEKVRKLETILKNINYLLINEIRSLSLVIKEINGLGNLNIMSSPSREKISHMRWTLHYCDSSIGINVFNPLLKEKRPYTSSSMHTYRKPPYEDDFIYYEYNIFRIKETVINSKILHDKITDALGIKDEFINNLSTTLILTTINAVEKLIQNALHLPHFPSKYLFIKPKFERETPSKETVIAQGISTLVLFRQFKISEELRSKLDNTINILTNKQFDLQHPYKLEEKPKEGCYIATMLYGDYDHLRVLVLRNFRDNFLNKRNWGKKFIAYYYAHSPHWVKNLKNID